MTTLVLLPGMDGTGILFKPFLQALPPDLPVKVVAYPGHAPLSYEELESLVQAALPAQGPIVFLGESFSGPIAASLAAKLPGRVNGLILCCTFVRNPRSVLSVFKPLANLISPDLVPIRLAAWLLLGSFATPDLRALLRTALAGVSPSVLRARLNAVVTVNASAALAEVKVPVLYMQAAQDNLVPSGAARLAMAACPSMKVIPFKGPHCLLQAVPAEAAAVVAAFVRNVESGC